MRGVKNLKGFRDFLPEEAKKRNLVKNRLIEIFELWGYEPIESPTLEPLELFEGEIGEDERLFYKFEDYGKRKVALRYDQTVPTVRIIGQYLNELIFPFKRYQIQTVFRAEKPQKGRYREFLQADIDIFGVSSPIADAEVIAVGLDVFKQLGFKNFKAKINNRDLLTGIPYKALSSIDNLAKIGEEGVIADMVTRGFSKKVAMNYLSKTKKMKPDKKLENVFRYLKNAGFGEENYEFSPDIIRSFSYSEGIIWEIVSKDYGKGALSLAGGERYDGMVKRITGKDIPATGMSFGFDRMIEAMDEANITLTQDKKKVFVSVFNSDLFEKSMKVSLSFRKAGIESFTYPDSETKLDKQIKYADQKKYAFVAIIGPDEEKEGKIALKNLLTGEQESLSIEDAIKKIKSSSLPR